MTTIQLSPAKPKVAIRAANGRLLAVKFEQYSPPRRSFQAVVCPEDEGGFSVLALNFPGVISQAETEVEAEENIREAFLAMLESCQKHGEALPYSPQPVIEMAAGCRQIWVKVDG